MLFSLPLLVYLVVRIIRSDASLRGKLLSRIALPAGFLLLAGALWMLYYDSRTVGNPWTMPYMVNHAEYHVTKPFLGQARNPIPAYRHDSMRRFYVIHELPDYLDSRTFWGIRQLVERNAAIVYVFFFCPVGLLMLAGWLRMLRRPGQSMIAVSAVAAVVPSLVGLWPPHGHYAAPATGAFILIGLVGLRRLRTTKVRGARIGLALSRAVVILLAVALLAATSAKIMDPFELHAAAANSPSPLPLRIERERMESQLSRHAGPAPGDCFLRSHGRSQRGMDRKPARSARVQNHLGARHGGGEERGIAQSLSGAPALVCLSQRPLAAVDTQLGRELLSLLFEMRGSRPSRTERHLPSWTY